MSCGIHRPPRAAVEACTVCRAAAAATLRKNVEALGPRTPDQLEALVAAVRQRAPWFAVAVCGAALETLPDGTTADATYALAARTADACMLPQPFAAAVPDPTARDALRRAVRRGAAAAKLVDIYAAHPPSASRSTEMVRARSTHDARDKPSLVAALRRAGAAGISRGAIAAEYETAYLDIETLIPAEVYATEHHAWHRDVAPGRVPGLLEAATAAGLAGHAL